MGQIIGDVLPLGLGIAISPIPIIATILMLLSPQAKKTSIGFMLGWVTGVIIAVGIFTSVSALFTGDEPNASPVSGIIKIILGVLLLVLAAKKWRGITQSDHEPELPKWMSALDTMSAGRAALLAFALAAVNPKNLLLSVSAGVIIGAAPSTDTKVVAAIVFVALAISTVASPVIAYLLAAEKLAKPLEHLRVWLVHNNAAVMVVLLTVLGISVIGKGIGAL